MSRAAIPRRLDQANLAVKTAGVVKRFGRTTALESIDLTVPENAFYLLVGPNGAGKSTTLRLLLDVVRADAGIAEVFGMDTRRGASVRAQTGWVPDKHDVHLSWMNAGDLIAMHAAYYASWDNVYARRISDAFAIDPQRRMGKLSKGEVRRVQLLLALAHRPRLLLLDEPTDGLDPGARETVLGILAEHMSDTETTTIVSTHLVYELDRLADHIGVIRKGTLVAQLERGALDEMMRSYLLEVPADWAGEKQAENSVAPLRKTIRQRETQWLVWGDEEDVTTKLVASGATVRDTSAVSLEDAVIALMGALDEVTT